MLKHTKLKLAHLATSLILFAISGMVFASPIFQIGGELSNPTNIANFSNLAKNASLLNYQENGINVSVNDIEYPYPGVGWYYGSAGNVSYVDVSLQNNAARIFDLSFNLSNGNAGTYTNLFWQTYNNNIMTGSGNVYVRKGIVSWTDTIGFDHIYLKAFVNPIADINSFQAIAISNLKISSTSPNLVPEPTSIALLGMGALGFAASRRKKAV